jgi:hypothetical protein
MFLGSRDGAGGRHVGRTARASTMVQYRVHCSLQEARAVSEGARERLETHRHGRGVCTSGEDGGWGWRTGSPKPRARDRTRAAAAGQQGPPSTTSYFQRLRRTVSSCARNNNQYLDTFLSALLCPLIPRTLCAHPCRYQTGPLTALNCPAPATFLLAVASRP